MNPPTDDFHWEAPDATGRLLGSYWVPPGGRWVVLGANGKRWIPLG
jgi:hypothetical protein